MKDCSWHIIVPLLFYLPSIAYGIFWLVENHYGKSAFDRVKKHTVFASVVSLVAILAFLWTAFEIVFNKNEAMACFKNNNRTFTILTVILVILLVATGFAMNKNYHQHSKSGPSQSEKIWHSIWKFGSFALAILAIILMYMAISVFCDGDFWCLWFMTDGLGDVASALLEAAAKS